MLILGKETGEMSMITTQSSGSGCLGDPSGKGSIDTYCTYSSVVGGPGGAGSTIGFHRRDHATRSDILQKDDTVGGQVALGRQVPSYLRVVIAYSYAFAIADAVGGPGGAGSTKRFLCVVIATEWLFDHVPGHLVGAAKGFGLLLQE